MLRGTEGERKNNMRSQGEEGTIWPGCFLRSPEGDEPNISFWVFWDAELIYSSLKAAQLSVFRLFVSSSLSSSCPFHIYIYICCLFFLFWTLAELFLNMDAMPWIGQNMFFRILNSRLRVITASFCHPSVLLFDGKMAAFSLCTPKAKGY